MIGSPGLSTKFLDHHALRLPCILGVLAPDPVHCCPFCINLHVSRCEITIWIQHFDRSHFRQLNARSEADWDIGKEVERRDTNKSRRAQSP